MTTILVEGIGDVVDRLYGPALAKLKIDIPSIRIIYSDNSAYWPGVAGRPEKRKQTLETLKRWGGEFLDKGDEEDNDKYLQLRTSAQVDTVLIATNDATHTELAEAWLQNSYTKIFIEKPLTDSKGKAITFIGNTRRADQLRVRAFDHYRARMHLYLQHSANMRTILSRLDSIKVFRFFFVEDHSGTDAAYWNSLKARGQAPNDRNGPIEIECRQEPLREGLVLDMMPHMAALLSYFGHVGEISVDAVRAARYTGVDYDEKREVEIQAETFAAINFEFTDHMNKVVEGQAYVGKGVRGSKYHPNLEGNVKLLELEGTNGRRILFDFRNNIVSCVNRGNSVDNIGTLDQYPYYYLLQQIVQSKEPPTDVADKNSVTMSIKTGRRILEILDDIRFHIKPPLQTYPLGNREGRRPPYLEDLIESIRPLWGKD